MCHAGFGAFRPPAASIAFYRGYTYVLIVIFANVSQDRAVALAESADERLRVHGYSLVEAAGGTGWECH